MHFAMTRMLLPAQLFSFAGSMMSARLQVRKIFVYQACTPVIYNLGIVLGAYFLHRQFGMCTRLWWACLRAWSWGPPC